MPDNLKTNKKWSDYRAGVIVLVVAVILLGVIIASHRHVSLSHCNQLSSSSGKMVAARHYQQAYDQLKPDADKCINLYKTAKKKGDDLTNKKILSVKYSTYLAAAAFNLKKLDEAYKYSVPASVLYSGFSDDEKGKFPDAAIFQNTLRSYIYYKELPK